MKIIGITGKMGAGKDAVASAMSVADPSVRRIALADSLKRTAMDLFDLSYEQVFGSQAQKTQVDARWGKSPREILQALGTDVARNLHPDVWIRKMSRDMTLWEERQLAWVFEERWSLVYHGLKPDSPQRHPIWVVPDVRFPNEAAAIRAFGGVILKVWRNWRSRDAQSCTSCGERWYPSGGETLDFSEWHSPECRHAHPSERGVEDIKTDYIFHNDLGLDNVTYWAEHYLTRAKAERGWE
jgi:hypothetical protein